MARWSGTAFLLPAAACWWAERPVGDGTYALAAVGCCGSSESLAWTGAVAVTGYNLYLLLGADQSVESVGAVAAAAYCAFVDAISRELDPELVVMARATVHCAAAAGSLLLLCG